MEKYLLNKRLLVLESQLSYVSNVLQAIQGYSLQQASMMELQQEVLKSVSQLQCCRLFTTIFFFEAKAMVSQKTQLNSIMQFLETRLNKSSSNNLTRIDRTKEPSSDTQLTIAPCQDTKLTLKCAGTSHLVQWK